MACRTSERQPYNWFYKSSDHTLSAWSPTRSVTIPTWQPPPTPVVLMLGCALSPEWRIPHLHPTCSAGPPGTTTSACSTTHKKRGEAGKFPVFMVSFVNLQSADVQANTLRNGTDFGQTKTAIWMESRSPIFVSKAKRLTLLNNTLSTLCFKSNSNMCSSEVKAQHCIKWYI